MFLPPSFCLHFLPGQSSVLIPNSETGFAIDVAQVSKPAVSPVSKPAAHRLFSTLGIFQASQVWKPSIQQTWKSALRYFQRLTDATSEFGLKPPRQQVPVHFGTKPDASTIF